jgi:glucose-6-phosphate isomerase
LTDASALPSVMALGTYGPAVNEALERLDREGTIPRAWAGDYTIWNRRPTEITDRLGWLSVTGKMRLQVDELRAFARGVRADGLTHAVLLGMGGSSLGPEVLRAVLGASTEEGVGLTVLDSTVPERVRAVDASLDPAHTLFLVSSKSGTTIEPLSLYRHYRALVEEAVGPEAAGARFAAVTDPGTPLADLAKEAGFRACFEAQADIGGRYSVLSHFGMVPAALMGLALERLLDRASVMAGLCGPGEARANPGAWLGAYLAAGVPDGRDKLTLITSPALEPFGLWAEQLIAESTGKDGTGIVPVAGEPALEPAAYGDDRLFVYLRLEGDANAPLDVAAERIAALEQPIIRLDLKDRYDLAAEFFRWQIATAIAGALLGIHPFDQPDVQAAKDAASRALRASQRSSGLADPEPGPSIDALLADAPHGAYLGVLVYAAQTEGVDGALRALRKRVGTERRIATTAGYGPRYLHSTGQLHKGGPANGRFLVLTVDEGEDIPVPGEPHTLGQLARAQAVGDVDALRGAGRQVTHVHLGADAEGGLLRLLAAL